MVEEGDGVCTAVTHFRIALYIGIIYWHLQSPLLNRVSNLFVCLDEGRCLIRGQ